MTAKAPIPTPIQNTQTNFKVKFERKDLTRRNSEVGTFDVSEYWYLKNDFEEVGFFEEKREYYTSPPIPRGISLGTKEDLHYLLLRKQFNDEIESSLIENSSEVEKTFELMSEELKKIYFKESVVEITPSSSLKFTLLIDDTRMVMVSKSFETFEDQPLGDFVIFSFFIDRKLIVSNAIELKAFVKGLNKYLNS